MKRKLLGVILCASMLMTAFSGCGGDSAKSKKDAGDDKTLTVWSIATESDAFHPAYTKAIEDFEKSHPGVKIKFETFENESYKTKIKSAVAANELPDVFFTWAGGFSKSFVESGKVLELDSYYEKYKEDLPEKTVENTTYNGKLYGSVIATPVSMMFYNKKIFEENKVEVPTTWEEWKAVCETLKQNGVTPIGVSAKDTWVLAMTHDAMALKSAGADKLKKALLREGGLSTLFQTTFLRVCFSNSFGVK